MCLRPLHHALWADFALILPHSCGTFVVDVVSHKHSSHLWNSFDIYVLKLYLICIDICSIYTNIIYPPPFIDATIWPYDPGLPDTRRHNMRHPHVAAHEARGIMWIPPKSDVTRSRRLTINYLNIVHINSSRERNDVNPTNKRTHRRKLPYFRHQHYKKHRKLRSTQHRSIGLWSVLPLRHQNLAVWAKAFSSSSKARKSAIDFWY